MTHGGSALGAAGASSVRVSLVELKEYSFHKEAQNQGFYRYCDAFSSQMSRTRPTAAPKGGGKEFDP